MTGFDFESLLSYVEVPYPWLIGKTSCTCIAKRLPDSIFIHNIDTPQSRLSAPAEGASVARAYH
jgi:hypothetical protein